MEDRKNAVNGTDADERLDANGLEERKDIDTRRWKAEDDNGHMIGSQQANSNEQDTVQERAKEDQGEYNKLDDRGTVSGNEAS